MAGRRLTEDNQAGRTILRGQAPFFETLPGIYQLPRQTMAAACLPAFCALLHESACAVYLPGFLRLVALEHCLPAAAWHVTAAETGWLMPLLSASWLSMPAGHPPDRFGCMVGSYLRCHFTALDCRLHAAHFATAGIPNQTSPTLGFWFWWVAFLHLTYAFCLPFATAHRTAWWTPVYTTARTSVRMPSPFVLTDFPCYPCT